MPFDPIKLGQAGADLDTAAAAIGADLDKAAVTITQGIPALIAGGNAILDRAAKLIERVDGTTITAQATITIHIGGVKKP